MGLSLPPHLASQVADDTIPLAEALSLAVGEALESQGQEFLALEYLRQLTELNHPNTRVQVITGPRAA